MCKIWDIAVSYTHLNLARLQHELKTKDWFQTLPDFNAYVVRKGQALSCLLYTSRCV